METSFSEDFFTVLEFSRNEALRTGWHNISPDHIMLAVLRHKENPACYALERCGVCTDEFKASLDDALFVDEQIPWSERESINFCESALSMLRHASVEAMRCHAGMLDSFHFLLAVCRIEGSCSHDYLKAHGIQLRTLVESTGLKWENYGLLQPALPDSGLQETPEKLSDSTRLSTLASAFEERLRSGYTPDDIAS